MKIYISAAREEKERATELASMFEQIGCTIVDHWFDAELPPTDENEPGASQWEIAARQCEAIQSCNLFVYLSPPIGIGRGCHIEYGYALGVLPSDAVLVMNASAVRSNFETRARVFKQSAFDLVAGIEKLLRYRQQRGEMLMQLNTHSSFAKFVK